MDKSESIKELAGALSKAQGGMRAATKDAANPFFKSKYADLASIIDAIKEPLASNGLSFVQLAGAEDDIVTVETVLMHESGEYIAGTLSMKPVKADPQGVGSCITYARRYGLQAIVGIPTEDDDGNAATRPDDRAAQNQMAVQKQADKLQKQGMSKEEAEKMAEPAFPHDGDEEATIAEVIKKIVGQRDLITLSEYRELLRNQVNSKIINLSKPEQNVVKVTFDKRESELVEELIGRVNEINSRPNFNNSFKKYEHIAVERAKNGYPSLQEAYDAAFERVESKLNKESK